MTFIYLSLAFLWLFAIATFFAIRKIVRLLYKLSDDVDLLVMQDALEDWDKTKAAEKILDRVNTKLSTKVPVVNMKKAPKGEYKKRTW